MRKGRLFLLSLRVAAGRVSLWGTCMLVVALAAMAVAFPWHAWFCGFGRSPL